MWPDVWIKSSPNFSRSFQKVGTAVLLKSVIFNNGPKSFPNVWAICARIFYPRTLKISPISSHLESFGLHFLVVVVVVVVGSPCRNQLFISFNYVNEQKIFSGGVDSSSFFIINKIDFFPLRLIAMISWSKYLLALACQKLFPALDQ